MPRPGGGHGDGQMERSRSTSAKCRRCGRGEVKDGRSEMDEDAEEKQSTEVCTCTDGRLVHRGSLSLHMQAGGEEKQLGSATICSCTAGEAEQRALRSYGRHLRFSL